MKRYVSISLLSVVVIFGVAYFLAFQPLLMILNGYSAKRICSSHFIAERSLENIEKEDLVYPATYTSNIIDEDNLIVHSSIYGMAKQSAVFRPGFGCTVAPRTTDDLKSVPTLSKSAPYETEEIFQPQEVLGNIDYNKLKTAVSKAFGTADRTRAVLVLHRGELIAEQYEDGFDEETELLGWSMSKSITNNLVGILIKKGKLKLEQQSLLPEWDDERSEITLEQMLHMASDLSWKEEDGYLSDVTRMLYMRDDPADYATKKTIREEIGTSFIYSSGTTNIISKIIKNTFRTEVDYLKFPHQALFDKLGINATMELDASNQYIMSSYAYMTGRDWAKLGQFWLQKGMWNGEQILPEEWIDYSSTAGHGVNSVYGAHFWLNTDSFLYPNVPEDMYSARGFQGQQVIVIPSKETVIVRFGVDEGIETFDFNAFISSVLSSID